MSLSPSVRRCAKRPRHPRTAPATVITGQLLGTRAGFVAPYEKARATTGVYRSWFGSRRLHRDNHCGTSLTPASSYGRMKPVAGRPPQVCSERLVVLPGRPWLSPLFLQAEQRAESLGEHSRRHTAPDLSDPTQNVDTHLLGVLQGKPLLQGVPPLPKPEATPPRRTVARCASSSKEKRLELEGRACGNNTGTDGGRTADHPQSAAVRPHHVRAGRLKGLSGKAVEAVVLHAWPWWTMCRAVSGQDHPASAVQEFSRRIEVAGMAGGLSDDMQQYISKGARPGSGAGRAARPADGPARCAP